MKEVLFFYFLNYFIVFFISFLYQLFGFNQINYFTYYLLPYILLFFYIISILFLYLKNKKKERKIYFKRLFLFLPFGICISIFFNMIIFLLFPVTTINNDFSFLFLFFSSGIIGPIYEEILFRYVFYYKLRKKFSKKLAIVINAAVFGLLHINPIKIIFAFALGIIFAFTYEKEKNILFPILIHIGANSIALFLYQFNLTIFILSICCIFIYTYLILNDS